MRKVKNIISIRNKKDLRTRSWDIVFEWENIIAQKLNLNIVEKKGSFFFFFMQRLHLSKAFNLLFRSSHLSLEFVTDVKLKANSYASCNTIPIIIDFWYEKDEEIIKFIEHFKYVPLLFVTNKEVQTLLSSYVCPFAVEHFPLSLPDQYKLQDSSITKGKEYEFGFVGRIDNFFWELIQKYAERHEDFEYVYSKGISVEREFWTNKGRYLGKDEGRESYINFLRKTKISSYSTPGMDETKKVKYNQVTPRLLEMLANGCQVIGHYPLSDDVIWYNLPSVVKSVENYEDFEKELDSLRKKDFDFDKVSGFLSRHYTSSSVLLLSEALNKHSLI